MFILETRVNQELGAGEGPDTQSNEVITTKIKSKEPEESNTNKSNNKPKNHKNIIFLQLLIWAELSDQPRSWAESFALRSNLEC